MLLVIAVHTEILPGGYVGVDVFFVLSGYLITSVLLDQRDSGRWSIRRFYERRARRLFPALAGLLGVALVVVPLVPGSEPRRLLVVAVCAGYASDFVAAFHPGWLNGLAHTWSLAMEEQFYLVWPFVLKRLTSRMMVPVVCVAMLAMLVAGDPATVMYLPYARGGVILLGCCVALELRRRPTVHRPGLLAAASALALVAAVVLAPAAANPGAGAASVLAGLATAGLITGTAPGGTVTRLLSLQPMVWLGQRSYGIYLWHYPITYLLFVRNSAPVTARDVVLTVAGSVTIAAVSYQTIEMPFRSRGAVVSGLSHNLVDGHI